MTKIKFQDKRVIISGHSGYGTTGNDIVCSAISSIVTTSVRAILKYDKEAICLRQENGLVDIKIIKKSDFLCLIIDNMKELLKELEIQYSRYVKLEE